MTDHPKQVLIAVPTCKIHKCVLRVVNRVGHEEEKTLPSKNNWEEKGLYRLYSDVATGGEVVTSVLEAYGDARFDRLRYVINDFSQITCFEIDEFDLKRIAVTDDVVAMTNKNIKVAQVATNESLIAWIELYRHQMQHSPFEYKLFSTLADARAWINATG